MTQYLNIGDKGYEITGYADDGAPILKAQITVKEEGFDADGNPIRSVNINIPAAVGAPKNIEGTE